MNKQISQIKNKNELQEYWRQELNHVIKLYLIPIDGKETRLKFKILYIDKTNSIKSFMPFSPEKKNLPYMYTIRSNGDRYWYCDYKADLKFSIKSWLGKEELSFEDVI